jgi:hypothetical protein
VDGLPLRPCHGGAAGRAVRARGGVLPRAGLPVPLVPAAARACGLSAAGQAGLVVSWAWMAAMSPAGTRRCAWPPRICGGPGPATSALSCCCDTEDSAEIIVQRGGWDLRFVQHPQFHSNEHESSFWPAPEAVLRSPHRSAMVPRIQGSRQLRRVLDPPKCQRGTDN